MELWKFEEALETREEQAVSDSLRLCLEKAIGLSGVRAGGQGWSSRIFARRPWTEDEHSVTLCL